jgi:hypothetical protein
LVNASLNWASIVGIVLAVGGAFLYFMRSFKPALARDYDVFFAAIGLLCGGILFFQGWRLDPILQFGQFLLAATTVFFAYESVRLRGVTTEQARRSSYFEDEEEPVPFRPRGGLGGGRGWESDADRFDEPEPLRRRIPSREEPPEEDFYRPRRSSRAAIPERAASRRPPSDDWESSRREPGRGTEPGRTSGGGYSAGGDRGPARDFGDRRRERETGAETRRGSRPVPGGDGLPRSSRRPSATPTSEPPSTPGSTGGSPRGGPAGVPQGTPIRSGAPGPGRTSAAEGPGGDVSDADFTPMRSPRSRSSEGGGTPPRDNSSRFDD